MPTDLEIYQDFDDLQLICTIIESVTISFNPERLIEFKIIKPFDHSERILRYNQASLTFINVLYSNIEVVNEFHEYPEFHRSAILTDSKLLREITSKLSISNEASAKSYKDFYLHIDLGNKDSAIHIICENYELTLQSEPKLLTEFSGLDK